MARLYVPLKVNRATGRLRFQNREVYGAGVRIVPIGLSTPLRLPCPLHGGYEVVNTVSIGGRDPSTAAWTLLVLVQIVLAAANLRCDTFLRELNTLRVAFSQRLLSIPLGEVGREMHEALIDAMGAVMPFEQAVGALAEARLPAVVADANPRGRRALAGREERRTSDLVVGEDGTALPPGVPAWHLPHRGRGIWSWCELHHRWHCQLKASWPSGTAEVTYGVLASVAIGQRSSTCDEYRTRREIYLRGWREAGLYPPERPELTMLWYQAWARALREALQPLPALAAATLTS